MIKPATVRGTKDVEEEDLGYSHSRSRRYAFDVFGLGLMVCLVHHIAEIHRRDQG